MRRGTDKEMMEGMVLSSVGLRRSVGAELDSGPFLDLFHQAIENVGFGNSG
jgi:hypothetical protein